MLKNESQLGRICFANSWVWYSRNDFQFKGADGQYPSRMLQEAKLLRL